MRWLLNEWGTNPGQSSSRNDARGHRRAIHSGSSRRSRRSARRARHCYPTRTCTARAALPPSEELLTGPVLQRKPRDDDEPVVVGHLGGDLAQGVQGRQDAALALVPGFAEQCNTAALQLYVAAGAVVEPAESGLPQTQRPLLGERLGVIFVTHAQVVADPELAEHLRVGQVRQAKVGWHVHLGQDALVDHRLADVAEPSQSLHERASRVGTEVEGAETGLGRGRVEPAVLTRSEVGRVVLDPVHTRQRLLGRPGTGRKFTGQDIRVLGWRRRPDIDSPLAARYAASMTGWSSLAEAIHSSGVCSPSSC